MTPKAAILFLQALGVRGVLHGKWVTSSCPLAPLKHSKGTDSNPSFGVRYATDSYNCFACGGGSLFELWWQLADYVSKSPLRAHNVDVVGAKSLLDSSSDIYLPEYEEQPSPKIFQKWPGEFLQTFTSLEKADPRYTAYLSSRGVSLEEAKRWGIVVDSSKSMVVFPYHSASGELAGARGRSILSVGQRHHDYHFNGINNSAVIWYNEQCLNVPGPLIVVEGQFDAIAVARYHPKVVALLTAKAGPHKLSKLAQSTFIGFMLDGDKAGDSGFSTMSSYMSRFDTPLCRLEIPPDTDPDSMPPDILKSVIADFQSSCEKTQTLGELE